MKGKDKERSEAVLLLDDLEQRVIDLEVRVEKLSRHEAEWEHIAKEVARLRAEVEEFQQI